MAAAPESVAESVQMVVAHRCLPNDPGSKAVALENDHGGAGISAQVRRMTLAENQQVLTATLAALPNGQQRLAWLVEQARQRPLMTAELRTDARRVPGCLARLWFVPEFRDGRCFFSAESDSLIVKSIAGLLCDFYSDRAPEEILAHNPDFLGRLGIQQHITPNRRNALSRVWDNIRAFAQTHVVAADARRL